MQIGLFNINMHCCAYPDAMAKVAKAAEDAGFDSVWTGEHVVLPDPQAPPSPLPPEGELLDPAVALAYVAALTSTIKLGTGIIILPQRNPVVLAKELASLDVVSNGRLIFGVGVGYLGAEFAAIGVPMEDRAERSVEYIGAMRSLWVDDKPEFHGRFVDFANVAARPRPVQRPIPVVMGGHAPPAHRRAVTLSEGWFGFALDAEATAANLAGLKREADRHERPAHLPTLEISVTPRGRPNGEMVETFAELGVDRLILIPKGDTADDWLRWIDDTAPLVMGH